MITARIQSLHLLDKAVWQELERAAQQRGHAWRTLALATVDGERAEARTIILRETRAHERRLNFYTDARSPKLAQIQAHPLGTLLAWSSELGWQLRMRVRLTPHVAGLAVASHWARLKSSPAAQDYLSPVAPGEPVETFEVNHGSREHFALVEAQVLEIDWLELHPEGHRRAVFDADGGRWVQP